MRPRAAALAALGILWSVAAAAPATAQTAACVLYDEPDFGGAAMALPQTDAPQRLGRRFDNRASSARVTPGCRLMLWDDADLRGPAMAVEGDLDFLAGGWSDRASAYACECGLLDEIVTGVGRPPRPDRADLACVVFRDFGYRGPWRAFRAGERDRELGRRLRGRISSARVAPGCSLMLDIRRDYQLFLDHDSPDLGERFEDRAVAVTCFCE